MQQARNLMMQLGDDQRFRLLIRDRDSKFGGPFDEIFHSEGVRVIRTPVRAPNANAYAERWVRTLREDCLDRLLIVVRRHLERVLCVYVPHYNEHIGPTTRSDSRRRIAWRPFRPRRCLWALSAVTSSAD